MKPMKFPVRLHGYGAAVAIRLPRPMGGSAKIFLRNVAKARLPELYHAPIECGISGRTDSGEEIPINSVGRWLFGVPGYMGHIRVSNWEGDLAQVEFPADSPAIVHQLIRRLKAVVEEVDIPSGSEVEGVLERAMRLIRERKPQASLQKKAAFANSVQTLVTGWSGGFGRPSVREHAASRLYGAKAGRYTFEEAVELLILDEGPIFGPLTEIHRRCWEEEFCFDDDPDDVRELSGGSDF
jgi:hypothetical protein